MNEAQILVFGMASVFLVVAFIAGKLFDRFKTGSKREKQTDRRRSTRLARP